MRGAGERTAFISLSLVLSACGGGDGAGTVPFSSWGAVEPNSPVVAEGLSVENGVVSASSPPTTATITIDADRNFTSLVLTTPTTTVNLDSFASLGSVFDGFLKATSGAEPSITAVVANPKLLNYNYQTFGVWETPSSNTIGAFSVGAPTPGSSIPAFDKVSFVGDLAGIYVDGLGNRYYASGEVDLVASFSGSAQSLEFSTKNTVFRESLSSTVNVPIALELQGTLTYNSGTNRFTGAVQPNDFGGTVSPPALIGSSTAQFFGSTAQELGGVFNLSNPSDPTQTYSGAYGATQTPVP